MRLTRRGWAVVAVGVFGTAMAALFGARSLNAVVFPCVVALVAALVQVRGVEPPTVERALPADGFPGDAGTVTLRFETDAPFTATVHDALPPSVEGDARSRTTVGNEAVSYEVTYRSRGLHTIGPVSFVASDVLGLATRRFSVGVTDDVLVYPSVHDLTGRARRDLVALQHTAESHDRDEFDRLREYVRGDSLRDVHWKSSAKREDLIVKEFSADDRSQTLTVALSADRGRADEMAEAGGTIALALLHAGIPVTLLTPGGTVSAAPGDRERLLEHLAHVGHGRAETEEEPPIEVRATRGGTQVRLGGTELPFDRLVARRADAESRSDRGRPAPGDDRRDRATDRRRRGRGVAA
jgi:uncharacterized protein (DUF58 family)